MQNSEVILGHIWPLLKQFGYFEEAGAVAKNWLESKIKLSFMLSLSKTLIITVLSNFPDFDKSSNLLVYFLPTFPFLG